MIELRDATIRSGLFQLTSVNLSVARGQHVVLMGQTGQGKTTLLEAICGLRAVMAGAVFINGANVTAWKPGDRTVGYVPQDLALFPGLSVRSHLEFALTLRRVKSADRAARVTELAELLGLQHLLDRGIHGLSGGEAQRVALGRALSFRPQVLLLDEPFSAVDEQTRAGLHDVLRQLRGRTGVTILHVTHQRLDADALADRVLVLSAGRITERDA